MSTELKTVIAKKVQQAVVSLKNVSAVALITKGMEVLTQYPSLSETDRKTMLLEALKVIAAGTDGVNGTADDVIPLATLTQLQYMLQNDIVHDVVSVVQDAAAGKLNLIEATSLVNKLTSCCVKPKVSSG